MIIIFQEGCQRQLSGGQLSRGVIQGGNYRGAKVMCDVLNKKTNMRLKIIVVMSKGYIDIRDPIITSSSISPANSVEQLDPRYT
jgi:hypothetical protein